MKKYNLHIFMGALFLGFGLLFNTCQQELDTPPVLQYDATVHGKVNTTIAQLLSYHTAGSLDSFDSIPAGTIIAGQVISSDEQGNCYKFLTIQDSTGGVQVQIDNSSLSYKYKVGQRVVIKCDGLTAKGDELILGDYRKLMQLGWWGNGEMQRISSEKESNYIYRDGLPGTPPTPKKINMLSDITPADYNTLVCIENASFDRGGTVVYADMTDSYTTCSRTLTLSDGKIVEVRISDYAKFGQDTLPAGRGSVTGILTLYNNTTQLVIRDLQDVDFAVEQEIARVDFTTNLLQNGWKNEQVSGTSGWNYTATKMLQISGTNGQQNEAWCVSPAMHIVSNEPVKLEIGHRIPNNLGSSANMKLYYSITAMGNFNPADWTEIALPGYPAAAGQVSVLELPRETQNNPNLKFAFRYADNRASTWAVFSMIFKTKVKI